MNRKEAEALVAALSLLGEARAKGRAYVRKHPDKDRVIPTGPNEWQIMNAENCILAVLREETSSEAVRDLYTMWVDATGWAISWKPWSMEQEMEQYKDNVFISRFLENFNEE